MFTHTAAPKTMTFPLHLPEQGTTARRSRLLIADDDVDGLRLLQHALDATYDVVAVLDGEDALAALAQESFDLVVVDVVMRAVSGLDVLRDIRQKWPHLPVILLSGLSHSEQILEGLAGGASDYITKPYDVKVVQARIEHHLQIKQMLDERQQTIHNLQQVQEAKDSFLRIAVHDLQNPLNNIRLAHYYLSTAERNDDPGAQDALNTIEDTLNAMNDLVADFLDSALLQAGKADIQFGPVALREVTDQIVALYSAQANRKGITLLGDSVTGVVRADPNRLGQIIGNLVSNAIKFSPSGTTVRIQTEAHAGCQRIAVADEGPGIPESERGQLFEAFGKLSPRPTAGETSTGLGLWIVKELTRLQNGTVGVVCPPDGGSIFWVELPSSDESTDLSSL
jgi:signal transduction histidine kinase